MTRTKRPSFVDYVKKARTEKVSLIPEVKSTAGDIALLKVQCSQTMEFCAREAMQILGGMGYMRGSRIERIYREVRVNAIGGGSEEIMRDLAARQFGL